MVPISGTGTETAPCCVFYKSSTVYHLKFLSLNSEFQRKKKWVYFPAEKCPSALLAHTTNDHLLKCSVVCGRDFLNTATKQLGTLRAKCVSAVVGFLSKHGHTLPLAGQNFRMWWYNVLRSMQIASHEVVIGRVKSMLLIRVLTLTSLHFFNSEWRLLCMIACIILPRLEFAKQQFYLAWLDNSGLIMIYDKNSRVFKDFKACVCGFSRTM